MSSKSKATQIEERSAKLYLEASRLIARHFPPEFDDTQGPPHFTEQSRPPFRWENVEALETKRREGRLKIKQGPRTDIDILYPIIHWLERNATVLRHNNIISEPIPIKEIKAGSHHGPVMVIGMITRLQMIDENDQERQAKRGYAFSGPTKAITIWVRDDAAEIWCKIDRRNYQRLKASIPNNVNLNTSLFAIKGTVPADFRMIKVGAIRHIADLS